MIGVVRDSGFAQRHLLELGECLRRFRLSAGVIQRLRERKQIFGVGRCFVA